ncbi:MAG: hypothetical protein AABO57_23660 [Acidobacteriota bacterium]
MQNTRIDRAAQLDETLRQRERERLSQYGTELHAYSHDVSKHQRKLNQTWEDLDFSVKVNAVLAFADARKIAGFVVVLMAALAAYLLDYIMLSSVSEYFASRVYDSESLKAAARVIVPAAIITLEMLISTQCCFANQPLPRSRSRVRWGWVFLGLVVGVVVPSMLIAVSLASQPQNADNAAKAVFTWETIGLVGLSLAVHGAILYGGALALEAKAWALVRINQRLLSRRIARLENKLEDAATALTNVFCEYVDALKNYNAQVQAAKRLPAISLDAQTRALLAERMGRDFMSRQLSFDLDWNSAWPVSQPDVLGLPGSTRSDRTGEAGMVT